MATPDPTNSEAAEALPGEVQRNLRALAVIALVLWGLAAVFVLLPTKDPIPVFTPTLVLAEDIDPSPRFTPMNDDAVALISVFERNCMECHRDLVDNDQPRTDINHYHDSVQMDHGLNGRCINCHDQKDRNKLVLRDGSTIGFSDSTLLCSNCHGPAYRQWQRGVHGKTLGYWDPEQGEQNRLQCVECHNPHSPHYDPMAPLPGPNTLRMGDQDTSGHGRGQTSSPLMRALLHESHGDTEGHPTE